MSNQMEEAKEMALNVARMHMAGVVIEALSKPRGQLGMVQPNKLEQATYQAALEFAALQLTSVVTVKAS